MTTQFVQTLLAPGQMVDLLGGGLLHGFPDCSIAG